MKKVLALTSMLLVIASSAFATGVTSGTVTGEGATLYSSANAPTPIVKFSTGVNGIPVFSTTAYSIYTKHKSGSKVFGTANDSTSIYWKATSAGTLGTGEITDTTTSGNGAFATGWTTY